LDILLDNLKLIVSEIIKIVEESVDLTVEILAH